MSGIDELLREVLTEDANSQLVAPDLAARAMCEGRKVRRRRRIAVVSASMMSIAGLVLGSLAIAGSIRGADNQVVMPAHEDNGRAFWDAWGPSREYHSSPTSTFFEGLDGSRRIAAGELPDGADFVMIDGGPGVEYLEGWNGRGFAGLAAGGGSVLAPSTGYLTLTVPTTSSLEAHRVRRQWLVVVAKPGTTSAAYSTDGANWREMTVDHGIAALQIGGAIPTSAELRLTYAGEAKAGPLVLPAGGLGLPSPTTRFLHGSQH